MIGKFWTHFANFTPFESGSSANPFSWILFLNNPRAIRAVSIPTGVRIQFAPTAQRTSFQEFRITVFFTLTTGWVEPSSFRAHPKAFIIQNPIALRAGLHETKTARWISSTT